MQRARSRDILHPISVINQWIVSNFTCFPTKVVSVLGCKFLWVPVCHTTLTTIRQTLDAAYRSFQSVMGIDGLYSSTESRYLTSFILRAIGSSFFWSSGADIITISASQERMTRPHCGV